MGETDGYRGPSLKLLKDAGAGVGDVVELDLHGQKVQGTVVPRYQHNDDSHVVIKLKSGYNVGIRVGRIGSVRRLSAGEMPAFTASPPRPRGDLPEVAILGTGGTIASRVDYRTGAVRAAISSDDLYSLMPELSDIARIRPEIVLSVYSENLEPGDWQKIAESTAKAVKDGVRGVVVTTGTDTMGYTSAALSFALQGVPVPVMVVGSQRSSDRPSSDAYLNMIGAVTMAVSADLSGVYLTMHTDTNDETLSVHRGTRVRKNHTSARDAFQSIGVDPVAYWTRDGMRLVSVGSPARGQGKFTPRTKFDPAVSLVKFYPSMPAALLESYLAGMKGVVIEGSGLGHVNRKSIPAIQKFTESGGVVCMTSQCIWGRVDMNVYDTGRDLLKAGVLPLEDMLPETALAKLMWSFANASSNEEVKRMMVTNLVGEMTERSRPGREA